MSEENQNTPDTGADKEDFFESFADSLMKEAADLTAQKQAPADLSFFTSPASSGQDEETEEEGEDAGEDILADLMPGKKAKPKAAAPKKPSSRKKANVEDLGDGSGYIAPVQVNDALAKELEAEANDGAEWYAVHCYSAQENKVKHNLEQRIETMGMVGKILKVVVPTEEELEVKDGKRRAVERRVMPGYILVRMIMSEEAWFVVRNTPGVTRFVGMGNRPAPLTKADVDQILHRMEAEAPKLKVNYRPGQKVRITDGPFADFMGLVDKIDTERAKVSVLVSFFGRDTPVELDFLQVERM
jgi:transcriptional antiterminator NusG